MDGCPEEAKKIFLVRKVLMLTFSFPGAGVILFT